VCACANLRNERKEKTSERVCERVLIAFWLREKDAPPKMPTRNKKKKKKEEKSSSSEKEG